MRQTSSLTVAEIERETALASQVLQYVSYSHTGTTVYSVKSGSTFAVMGCCKSKVSDQHGTSPYVPGTVGSDEHGYVR
jgi:hypothetical protein